MNSQHLPGVEIIRVCPVKPAPERMGVREKKFYSIIIKFATPEVANEVVSCGVTFHRQNMVIELYDRGARLRQCFQC